MSKPRIIIADTDFNYIVTLQMKFVEEFFDKIDLEIITDKEYFENLFSTPQCAEILIISEELYDASLRRHNIGTTFLMVEQDTGEREADSNISRLFKYTNIKEIFNKIIGKSMGVLDVDRSTKKETQIVLVCSACGGVGKTTLAMGVSACLTKNYKRVLYMNASRLQDFHHLLVNKSVISATDIYATLAIGSDHIYSEIKHNIKKEIFNYLPPFKASLMSLGLPYSIYRKIALSAKKTNEYDFIVIDADTTFDEEKAKLLNIANKVIVVTEQTSRSVFATNLLISNINDINSDKYIFICNNFDCNDNNALTLADMEAKFSVDDYIERFNHYNQMKCEDLSKEKDIQRATFLIV